MPEGYTRDPGMPLVFGSQGSDWWPAAVCSGHRLLGGGGADSPSPNPGWAVKWERRGNKEKKRKKKKRETQPLIGEEALHLCHPGLSLGIYP